MHKSGQQAGGAQMLLGSISELLKRLGRRWGGQMFVGDLGAKWPHLFVIKFVYWWWNVCILCITCS